MSENQTNRASAMSTIIPVFIAIVVLAFFLIVGIPEDKAAPYIGLVASERRAAALLDYLRALPTPDERVSKIRIRTGIDLGNVGHEEMAVSILAELVAERASGALGPGAGAAMAPAAVSAIDPVCGMSVEIENARFTHDHLGEATYFCCPACRTAFIADPDAYSAA